MTTYELPPEPPVGTRLTDRHGETWTRGEHYWKAGSGGMVHWGELVSIYSPLTEVTAPALPTEDGALILASGKSSGGPFENKVLELSSGLWHGNVFDSCATPREITSWTEAVAVPKAEYDALREAVRDLASIGPHSSSVTPRFTVVNLAFELVNAAEEAER